jgi:hypothetical protein
MTYMLGIVFDTGQGYLGTYSLLNSLYDLDVVLDKILGQILEI